MFWILIFKKDR